MALGTSSSTPLLFFASRISLRLLAKKAHPVGKSGVV
jgi:hypothetical protein